MERIDTATADPNANGTGLAGFTDGSLPATPPTDLNAKFFNNVQEELVNAVLTSGQTLNATIKNQLDLALRSFSSFGALAQGSSTTVTLSATSKGKHLVEGSSVNVTYLLPDETTILLCRTFEFWNIGSGTLTVQNSSGGTLFTVPPLCRGIVMSTSTVAADTGWRWVVDGTRGQLPGTITNDVADPGCVGEDILINRVRSNALTLSASAAVNLCTTTKVTLTAGDWDLRAAAHFELPGEESVGWTFDLGISRTSATLPATDTICVPTNGEVRDQFLMSFSETSAGVQTPTIEINPSIVLPNYRVSVASNTDLYLVAMASVPVQKAFGFMEARRIR